jgi:hypothetical protein
MKPYAVFPVKPFLAVTFLKFQFLGEILLDFVLWNNYNAVVLRTAAERDRFLDTKEIAQ